VGGRETTARFFGREWTLQSDAEKGPSAGHKQIKRKGALPADHEQGARSATVSSALFLDRPGRRPKENDAVLTVAQRTRQQELRHRASLALSAVDDDGHIRMRTAQVLRDPVDVSHPAPCARSADDARPLAVAAVAGQMRPDGSGKRAMRRPLDGVRFARTGSTAAAPGEPCRASATAAVCR